MAVNNLNSPNTATTLSVFSRPGEDIRLINTNSDSIFTFGDFRIYQPNLTESLTSDTLSLSFDSFSTLDTLKTADFKAPQSYTVSPNELNLVPQDPFSYAYFGSLYTATANAINNIIANFPYAILSYDYGTGNTIYDYSTTYNNITGVKTSTFKIPYSTLKNQGSVIVNSSSTMGNISLASDFGEFAVQMSAQTPSAKVGAHKIIGYNFSAGVNSYLEITIDAHLEYMSASTSTLPVYVRPTEQRLAEYKQNLSELEYNLLFGFKFNVLDVMDDITTTEEYIIWPRNIDGFNPDTFGDSYEEFSSSILKTATNTDDAKTNILIKTIIPENYLELDSSQQVYASLVQTYAKEFDEIKRYIDGIAYAHTVTYNKEENVPDKFLKKLSNLLGWKLTDKFNELDLFEYLAGDADGQGNSYSYYNLEIWRRILANINWLYKKKGTRDAIQFMFKLLGAPECLLDLDEFVYKIGQVANDPSQDTVPSEKINDLGYVDYNASIYAFQEGGKGRGTGQAYINQWRPEFNPIKEVDNIKVWVAYSSETNPSVFNTQDTLNTKEVCMTLDPASAIECDVFAFYKESGTCWMWGSYVPPFSSNTVPFEYLVEDCDDVQPENIQNMTIGQYLDYVYANLVEPRNRKVIGYTDTSFYYPQLRNAYLSYYLWTNPQSNRLTFRKLQPFIDLIQSSFYDYALQLLPATTILECGGTTIRNTVFNRQKFVYKPGLNDGSEFRKKLSKINPSVNLVTMKPKINDRIKTSLTPTTVELVFPKKIETSLTLINFSGMVNVNTFKQTVPTYSISGTVSSSSSLIVPQAPAFVAGP